METIKQVNPEDVIGPLHSSSIIHRYPKNPIFSAGHVPYPSVIAYNAGVVKYQGQYVMVFRNNVIFPGGLIVEDSDELIEFCLSFK